jgi:two-component system, NarL family, response regulator NreC
MVVASAHEVPKSIRVEVLADGAFLRRGVGALLARDQRFELALDAPASGVQGDEPGEVVVVANAAGAVAEAGQAVLDVHARLPDAAIVVLVMADDPLLSSRLLDCGALGVVLMDGAETELPEAVVAAAAGETHLSEPVSRRLEVLRASLQDESLSAREMGVLWLIARGFTSSEIAAQLGLSTRTIEAHRARMSRKLGARSRAELVRYALDRGLLGV